MYKAYLYLLLILSFPVFAHPSSEIRIMSYNIRNATGIDGRPDICRTASVITECAPDIIAIQEVDSATKRSLGKYILGDLSAKTGMIPIFAPAIDFDGGKYGIGILAREKTISIKHVMLPGREESRVLLIAEFENYYFCCTHLSLTENDRIASLSIINENIPTDKTVVIAGDFNDIPTSKFIGEFNKYFTIITDVGLPTFPADKPIETLDYIAIAKRPNTLFDISSTTTGNYPDASDHRPVIVNVRIDTKK